MRIPLPILAVALMPVLGLALVVTLPSTKSLGRPAGWMDDRGYTVHLKEPPQRIVSLAPSLTEMVFALGAGDRLIARTHFTVAPPEALGVPVIGGMADISPETIVAARPDLVLLTDLTPVSVAERLEAAGVPAVTFRHTSLEDTLSDMEALAGLIGEDARGRQLVGELRAQAALAGSERETGPRVLLLLDPDRLYSPGPGTYPHEIVARTGARQATDGLNVSWPELSLEQVLVFDPEVIVLGAGSEAAAAGAQAGWERLRADPKWQSVTAIRDNRVVIVPDALMTIPGPRVAEAIGRVASGLRHENDADSTSHRSETVASEETQ